MAQTIGGAAGLEGEGKKGIPEESTAATSLEDYAKRLFEQTDPLRTSLVGRSEEFLGGGGVTETPQFQGLRDVANVQFGQAREQALEDVPTGGALIDALTNIGGQKASFLTRGAGNIAEQELGRAFSLATGTPLTGSLAGLAGAGGVQAGLAQAKAEAQSGLKEGVGEFFGKLF